MAEEQETNSSLSFVRWLHAQAKSDSERTMPYAAIYRWGPNIHSIIGADGTFNSEWIALELSRQGATAEDLSALVSAEAAWRVDTIVETAEDSGIHLDVPGAEEDSVPSHVSKELEKTTAKVLCGFRNHRGEGCTAEAVEGAGRCGRHGGAITDPEVRRSFLLVSFAKVIDGSRVAVDALLDVAENGRSEMARVQAAKELLDRAGVQQDQHVHIHNPEDSASEDEMLSLLRDRLSETKSRLRLRAVEVTVDPSDGYGDYRSYEAEENTVPELVSNTDNDDDIVDAEILEEPEKVAERSV